MNNLDLNSLFSDIYSSCEEISVIANKAVLNRNRSSLLGNCAAQISTGLSDLKRNNLQKNPRILDALLLLAICLEDVKSFLEKFSALNQELAIAVVKGGSHCLEFVKLTEQLHHCCELVHLDIHIPEDDAFETDCADLVARLPSVLQHLFSKANTSTVLPFISKCKNLINAQRAIKNTYKGKRSRNEDVTMKSDDLQMVKPVGRGGFSTVWLGKYRGEDVAVKVLSVEATSKTLAEFQHEADLMRRLSNKNIVAYYGIMEIDNGKISGHCMIMEYMVNDSLFTFIKANKSAEMVWAKKVDIALDVASGIAFLHRLRIIHRDIKLGNILLDEHLQAKVADFGLSFTKTANNSIYTMNEGGTIPYMVFGKSNVGA